MQPFLVFGLAASIGSMGELAGHERRGSLPWPARSAIIGLMGAALGIRRDGDFSALEALDVTVGVYDNGVFLRDYHTIETVPSAAAKKPNSRPDALRQAAGATKTTITMRDYRGGPLFGVAARGEGLEAIAVALNAPVFTLYFGRKSCPLSAPPGARVVQAETPETALAQLVLPPWRAQARLQGIVTEDERGEIVHDRATDRIRWHFASRRVAVRRLSGGGGS